MDPTLCKQFAEISHSQDQVCTGGLATSQSFQEASSKQKAGPGRTILAPIFETSFENSDITSSAGVHPRDFSEHLLASRHTN